MPALQLAKPDVRCIYGLGVHGHRRNAHEPLCSTQRVTPAGTHLFPLSKACLRAATVSAAVMRPRDAVPGRSPWLSADLRLLPPLRWARGASMCHISAQPPTTAAGVLEVPLSWLHPRCHPVEPGDAFVQHMALPI